MKNSLIIGAVIAALFLSACGPDYYDRVIRNATTATTVSYVYDGKAESLGPDDSRTYSVTLAVHDPSSVQVVNGHQKSIVTKADGFDYVFEDAPKLDLVVENKLAVNITISSEYIDKANDSIFNDTSFILSEGKTTTDADVNIAAVIYTTMPVFTVTSDTLESPIVVEYQIINNKMTVTIRPSEV
jgi:hypothetical protein